METTTPSVDDGGSALAPLLKVPARAVSVVEHVCVVKNVDKGITSLGGPSKLSKALRSKPEPEEECEDGEDPGLKLPHFISASLRPDDPYAKRLLSTPVAIENLLLRVTVPKRTGRKRKRASSGPFLSDDETHSNGSATPAKPASSKSSSPRVDASAVFRSIQDNAANYTVTPVGIINESHRFRTLPDLQYALSGDSAVTGAMENLMPLRYSQLKDYNLSTAPGTDLTKHVPVSAEFLQIPVQFHYRFQQNPFIKYTGNPDKVEVNVQKRNTVDGYYFVKCDAEAVPRGPKPHMMAPEQILSPYVRAVIASIRAELARRPIITRHILYNTMGWDKRDRIREAAVYCGYFFETGPWREALIAWGVDPRKDPIYRKYQTISFMSFQRMGTPRSHYAFERHVRELARMSPSELRTQHTFDGVQVSHTGNLFQFCDISDPMIRGILDTDDIRTACAPTFQGWYHIGTWAKATVILKDKLSKLVVYAKRGGQPPDDSIYQRVLTWPEMWNDQEMFATYRMEVFDKKLHREKFQEHEVMSNVRVAARSPRYAFGKMDQDEARAQEQDGDEMMEVMHKGDAEDAEIPEDLEEVPDGADVIMNEGETDDSQEEDDDEDDDLDDEEDDLDDIEDRLGRRGDEDEDFDELPSGDEQYEDDATRMSRPFGGLYRRTRL